MTGRRRNRDPYLDVGERTRATLEHAATLDLTPTELRALLAVTHITTTRSRHGDHVWLAQIAALTYGVDTADEWMLPKTRKALARLRTLAVIEVEAPRGRPADPSYWVGHPDPSEAHVQAARSTARQQASLAPRRADRRPPARPATGPSVARPAAGSSTARHQKQHGPPAGLAGPLARPATSPPTEVFSEGNRGGKTEEDDADGQPGTDSVGPAADDDAPDEEWSGDHLTRILTATLNGSDPYGPAALEVATIDAHLAEHVAELRDVIARTAPALAHGDHRLILRHARNVATAHASDLPRLDLGTGVP